MKKRNLKSRILALAACTLVLISSLMLPIGAEDVTETITTETPSYTSPIDWSAYPSANLLDVNTATITSSFTNKNGEFYNIERYKTGIKMTVTRYLEKNYHVAKFIIGLTKDFLGKTLTLSVGEVTYSNPTTNSKPAIGVETSNINSYYTNGQNINNWSTTVKDKKLTFTIPNDTDYITCPYVQVFFYASYGGETNIGDVITYEDIMLNSGNVAYPFIPYMPYYVQEGYEKGFEDGVFSPSAEEYWYQIGYDYGHMDGYVTGTEDASGITDCTWHTDTQNHPFYNDVYQNAYEYFKTKHPELLERDLELMAQGAADWEFKEEIGFHYTCCANKNSYYLAGYEADIYLTGNSEGYETGYKEGHNTGKTTGYQEGLETAEKGTWENLIGAVVEAPVNAFQGLFNFEIMGLDMKAAFGSMLAICVLLIIIKKVVM